MNRPKFSISVVSPARNESKNLQNFISSLIKTLSKITRDWEIIIVNDNSTDNTEKLLESYSKKNKGIKYLTNRRRFGVTLSLWNGIYIAKKDIIIFLPADLESNPCEDIPKLYAKLTEGYDFVLGWRQNKNVGLIKSITTKLLHISVKILFGIKLHDLSWIKAFKRKILEEMPQLRSDWQKFFAVIAYYQGFRVTEVKTNWYPRKHGKSNFGKFGLKRIPASFFDLLNLWFLLNFSKKPMHIFGLSGAILFGIGILISFYIVYANYILLVNIDRHIPLVIMSSLFIFTGIQLLAIGFLAELTVINKEKK